MMVWLAKDNDNTFLSHSTEYILIEYRAGKTSYLYLLFATGVQQSYNCGGLGMLNCKDNPTDLKVAKNEKQE